MTASSYPKSAFILLAITFLEAGAFAVFIVVNPSYWKESIGVSEKLADDANFSYGFLLNFTPLLTAFLADNFLGRYYVLLIHAVAFIVGFILVSGSIVLSLPISGSVGALSLVCISTAVGINKVILPTFTADQFEGHHEEARNRMFSWYYMLCNLGGILSMQLVANLKDYFICFEKPCYLFVFGLCAGMVFLSAGLFIGFSRWFVRAPLNRNVLVEAVKCIFFALKGNPGEGEIKHSNDEKSFLDSAIPKYGEKFVADLKQSLKVASLFFIGIPYWTCYQTMFGSWRRQYSLVNGRIGDFTMTFINFLAIEPIVVVTSIFLQNTLIIPLLNKFTKVTPLKKMVAGGICAALSFACVVVVEQKIQNDVLPPLLNESKVVLWKQSSIQDDCELHLVKNDASVFIVDSHEGTMIVPGVFKAIYSCGFPRNITQLEDSVVVEEGINVLALFPSESGLMLKHSNVENERVTNGKTEIHLISCRESVPLNSETTEGMLNPTVFTAASTGFQSLEKKIRIPNSKGNDCEITVDLRDKSGSKLFVFDDFDCSLNSETPSFSRIHQELIAVPGYSVEGLWMWPQVILFALSESLLAVGALEFAYIQTTGSMKSFMQALWLCTAAMGNVLGFFLNQIGMAPLASHYVNVGIMTLFTVLFMISAYKYKYVEIEEDHAKDDEETIKK